MFGRSFRRLRGLARTVGRTYVHSSTTRPFVVASATGFVVCGVADVAAQYATQRWLVDDVEPVVVPVATNEATLALVAGPEGNKAEPTEDNKIIPYVEHRPFTFQWDPKRTAIMSAFGFLWYGGPCKGLYMAYERVIGSGTMRQAVVTAVVDVCGHTGFLLLPAFYCFTGFFNGESINQSTDRLQKEWLGSLMGMAGFWIPTCAINFCFVPQHSRILFVCCANVVNKTWLSWHVNKNRQKLTGAVLKAGAVVAK